ncbi:GNAT family N-acetyltransferase [Massilia violaceinigra]|uniref:GNAT family N-acetyltransferase n=1 Tax=Massilia violaceinigra TaxID=2045208 RepID=A0A2D2DG99_9BURK|nr:MULTISPECIES: GNAT family N-acetyltransferase [Massilia]ATQ73997.1 GNAT family N-acetyltransferase [Massilia violaceinigra]MDQ1814531.1 GNAT family N-acetyltransferase [Massilia sp. CCM 9210]MDQ1920054.1 GNAT family N-acetyltransferase [Massilia sp. CCM 9206]
MTAQAEAVIRYATLDDMEEVAALFDSYRQFYNEEPNYVGSLHFLRERVFLGESQVIVAVVGDEIAGFTQLFPSFSSVTMQRLWILNDLYVKQAFRSLGIGENLLQGAANFAHQAGAKQLFIEGAVDNLRACALYERFGFIRNRGYYYYHYPLHAAATTPDEQINVVPTAK